MKLNYIDWIYFRTQLEIEKQVLTFENSYRFYTYIET